MVNYAASIDFCTYAIPVPLDFISVSAASLCLSAPKFCLYLALAVSELIQSLLLSMARSSVLILRESSILVTVGSSRSCPDLLCDLRASAFGNTMCCRFVSV